MKESLNFKIAQQSNITKCSHKVKFNSSLYEYVFCLRIEIKDHKTPTSLKIQDEQCLDMNQFCVMTEDHLMLWRRALHEADEQKNIVIKVTECS